MKLTTHFTFEEFVEDIDSLSSMQKYMLQNLAECILEPIRQFLGCKMTVTSGLRTAGDFDRLKKSGYNPSEISDHYFGNIVPVMLEKNVSRYGHYYSYSVGAADVVPECGAEVAFKKLMAIANKNDATLYISSTAIIKIGQLICEQSPKSKWLHISNPKTLIYSEGFAKEFLKKTYFLTSEDNGKTYTPA